MEKHAFIRHHGFGEVECTGNCACLHILLCATPRFASTRFVRLPLAASFDLGSVPLDHFSPFLWHFDLVLVVELDGFPKAVGSAAPDGRGPVPVRYTLSRVPGNRRCIRLSATG
jgi:hypothetical protein